MFIKFKFYIIFKAAREGDINSVKLGANLLDYLSPLSCPLSQPITTIQRSEIDELCHGPPAFLWHYLRRSGAVSLKFLNLKKLKKIKEWLLSTFIGRSRQLYSGFNGAFNV